MSRHGGSLANSAGQNTLKKERGKAEAAAPKIARARPRKALRWYIVLEAPRSPFCAAPKATLPLNATVRKTFRACLRPHRLPGFAPCRAVPRPDAMTWSLRVDEPGMWLFDLRRNSPGGLKRLERPRERSRSKAFRESRGAATDSAAHRVSEHPSGNGSGLKRGVPPGGLRGSARAVQARFSGKCHRVQR
jgi:hypothetical protein